MKHIDTDFKAWYTNLMDTYWVLAYRANMVRKGGKQPLFKSQVPKGEPDE